MLNCGKKIRDTRDKKNKYSNSCVVRKKKRNKKPKHYHVKPTTCYKILISVQIVCMYTS